MSFYAEVLMQLAVPLLTVCQIVLRFQRVKETLSCSNFWRPVLNLASFIEQSFSFSNTMWFAFG